MSGSQVTIVSLSERLDYANTLALWHHAEWADYYTGWTFEKCLAELMTHTDPNTLPTSLVAIDRKGELLGSVSLLLDDLPGYEHFSPWLASLFVRPDQRRRGVGNALLDAAVARHQGLVSLHRGPGRLLFGSRMVASRAGICKRASCQHHG